MSDVDRSQWVVTLQGKQHPTWPLVLDELHKRGLTGIRCELVQIPTRDNEHTAIMKAVVTLGRTDEDRYEFTAYGDASPANTSARIASALIRMAETRAKGRAGRDACNIGATLLEELPEDEAKAAAVGPHRANGGAAGVPDRSGERPAVLPTDMAIKHGPPCQVCGQVVSANVYRASEKEFGRTFCAEHGKAERKRRAEAREPAAQPGAAVG